MLRFDKLLYMQIYKCIQFFFLSFILLSLYSLIASLTFVYLISFLTLLLRFFFVVPSLFVYFVAFNFFLPSVFFFLCVFLFMSLYKLIIIFLFCIIFFLMRCKYHNINIIYIYLNVYLCFYFSVSFAFPFLLQWIFFSCLSKVFLWLFLDEIVVFLMFIYLLILYDRLSLCFVVCFSS